MASNYPLHKFPLFPTLVTVAAVLVSTIFWTRGFLQSPFFHQSRLQETQLIKDFLDTGTTEYKDEELLAKSYWLRYGDVRKDSYWGIRGPLGIKGPKQHYLRFGRKEGRIFQPVIRPPDMEQEEKLAQDYWHRYPEIRTSPVWGKASALGILGPRDHFHYVGRHLKMQWATSPLPQ